MRSPSPNRRAASSTRAQPRLRRPEDHQRGDRRAADQQQQRADGERRADLVGDAAQSGQRRHPHHRDDLIVVLDRRHHRAAARRAERRPRPPSRRHRRPSARPLADRRIGGRRHPVAGHRGGGTDRGTACSRGIVGAGRRHGAAVGKNDRRRTMQFVDAALGVARADRAAGRAPARIRIPTPRAPRNRGPSAPACRLRSRRPPR